MFNVDPDPIFEAPVKIHVPGKGAGVIQVTYKYLNLEERAAYIKALGNKTNAEALQEIIVSWREIDTAYSPASLNKLLSKYDTAAKALFETFFRESSGAPEKN